MSVEVELDECGAGTEPGFKFGTIFFGAALCEFERLARESGFEIGVRQRRAEQSRPQKRGIRRRGWPRFALRGHDGRRHFTKWAGLFLSRLEDIREGNCVEICFRTFV